MVSCLEANRLLRRRTLPGPRDGRTRGRIETFNGEGASGVLMGETGKLEDADLVRSARQGDADAFGELVRRYSRAAYMVALGVTRNPADAEDVAQEAFIVALQRLEECRRPERFGGWFTTIVRNRAKNLNRREALRAAEAVSPNLPSGRPSPERSAETADMWEWILEAMNELPDAQRETLLLHDLEGWKHREIAERLGLPVGTVRSHLHFARKAVRARIGPLMDQPSQEGGGGG